MDNDRYSHADSDIQGTTPETTKLIPVYFKTCLQCKEENPDPHYQYCAKCFRVSEFYKFILITIQIYFFVSIKIFI